MVEYRSAKDFWEDKLLAWEEARYSSLGGLSPLSWTVRARLQKAVRLIQERMDVEDSILELACGSGILAQQIRCARYYGVDIAANAIVEARQRVPNPGYEFVAGDVLELSWPEADLTVFLGLTDWLNPPELERLFAKLASAEILFSYTQAGMLNPYRLYRRFMDSPQADRFDHAKMYSTDSVISLLQRHGYQADTVLAPSTANPGGLVWAVRAKGKPASDR